MPLRQVMDIQSIDISQIRPINLTDFKEALQTVKASVNHDDLSKFLEWNDKFGSVPIKPEELED